MLVMFLQVVLAMVHAAVDIMDNGVIHVSTVLFLLSVCFTDKGEHGV